MEKPFLAEIKFVTARVLPEGWAWCDGREMRIAEHPALFELLGTTFGGDGQSTFALPNLVGRKPVQIESHYANFALADQPSHPFGLKRRDQPDAALQLYGSTYFCIALKGVYPVSSTYSVAERIRDKKT
ncbi:phage tail protein [Dyadobacter sp. CY326]|uniref:phage tail protein n=1 Tax=Dyadobacter sp. CY326 TaxID=2907300 RepID=UPI001F3999D7|nr:tail fiber protein [Dyadobacter sp. CY326]MCE7067131.1 tail fiber protein [Dyadobacter sp. CY326]